MGSATEQFRVHEAALLRLARRHVGDDERAREIVQDTFVRFLERPESAEGKLPGWLFKVCRNRAIDVARRERVRRSPVVAVGRPESSPAVRLDAERAVRAISELPERQRRIVEMRLAEGASYREIAEALGLSETNVGYLMHTALVSVRAKLGGER